MDYTSIPPTPTHSRVRKSTGKRVRFEVFKRDHFTCQYCGAQPPDAVLVIDHIEPVAHGGASTIDNLITACEPCNQGKSDRLLTTRQIRPDADLMWLEAQQEIAELRRFQQIKAERDLVMLSVIEQLQDSWCSISGLDWSPNDRAVRLLVDKYGPDIAEEALNDVALKLGTGYLPTDSRKWLPYLNAVARNLAADA